MTLQRGATALSEIVADVVWLSGECASARDASEREHAPGDSSSVARSFAADEGGRVRACPFHLCETTAVSASPGAGDCAMIYKERWSRSCPDSDSELDEAEDATNDSPDPTNPGAPDRKKEGRLVVAEEIEVGHVSWAACMFNSRLILLL